VVDGKTWARFSATFEEVEANGDVRFQIRDRQRAGKGEITIEPAPGQVAYINERRMEFDELTRGTRVNLYVPEGHYGFASLPGGRVAQVSNGGGDAGAAFAQTSSRSSTSARTQDAEP